ncbi:MAG TPA: FAD binding domain-containing protein [Xanthobacteraceae bacterium]|jgi:CO/xanthine dehydrogenase FAD-binding subunit|nr:FAD binding domain-containing protein [Xanthobacteraceae bacterium]
MKPAPFEYVRPRSAAEICNLLASNDDAVIIAGGQTLVPMMAMRLARPRVLVDIARLPELSGIREEGDAIVIGATTRQAEIERSRTVAAKIPLLARALPWIGHAATRNRGTIGGSIANADPAAEIPLVAVTLGADILTVGPDGNHTVAAGAFFVGPMMTSMPPASFVAAVRFPVWKQTQAGVAFHEVSARASDFALAAAAAQVALDADGRCAACAIGVGGATPFPTRLDGAAQALLGTPMTDDAIRETIHAAMAGLEIMTDPHASPDYRRRAALALAVRALTDARDAARRGGAKAT